MNERRFYQRAKNELARNGFYHTVAQFFHSIKLKGGRHGDLTSQISKLVASPVDVTRSIEQPPEIKASR